MKPYTIDIDTARTRLSEFADEVTKVQTFKGKWSAVKSKLETLHTQLTDLADFPNAVSNPLFLDLIQSLAETLQSGAAVASRCRSESDCAKEGKLRTQNDVDSTIAKLDRHIRDSEILIKSGVLNDSVFVGSSARNEVKGLVTKLQIGSLESKNLTLDYILGLLVKDDKNIVISVSLGIVPVLMKLMDSSNVEIKEKVVYAISRVSVVESCRNALNSEGLMLLNHLIRVLESGSGFAKEKACIALQGLSLSKENARAVGSRGGISSLLEICENGTPNSQALAAGVLRNVSKFSETKENFMEEDAVVVLMGMLGSGTSLARENVIGCLSNLVKGDDDLKIRFGREGGIDRLKEFWDGSATDHSLQVAVDLLAELASCTLISEVLVSKGFIPRLVVVLDSNISALRIAAAKAVTELGFNSKTRKDLGDCGCIPLLSKMLEKKSIEEKEVAAKALSNLIQSATNKKIFKKDERSVVNMVQLLDPSVPNLDKKYPISILNSLAHSKKLRKLIITAGASLHLQKLVDMDVEGSKKLYESIRHGKVWGIFARP